VELENSSITAELTATARAAVHRYRFSGSGNLLVDLGAVVKTGLSFTEWDHMPRSLGGWVEMLSDREFCGRADLQGGWGHDFPYSVYFYARLSKLANLRYAIDSSGSRFESSATGPNTAAYFHFADPAEVELRVGISYVSLAKARASLEREVGEKSFDQVRAEAAQIWERTLSRIAVHGGTNADQKLFYSLFYRLACMPTDLGIDDEFGSWHSGVRHFTDYYCLWDSVRNADSFFALFDPELAVDKINCLLDVAEHTGWLPDAWIAGHSAFIQGGSSADILLSEYHQKRLEGIDTARGLELVLRNSETPSRDPFHRGRFLEDYERLGYVSTACPRSAVSRHLEYAYQDFCTAVLARSLGRNDAAQRKLRHSRKLWNLWRDDMGYFAPKNPDGSWAEPFDPLRPAAQSWLDPYFYEGPSAQWSFQTFHDFAGLVERRGGPEGFVRHLDEYFERGRHASKETILHVPFLYHYAGEPARSSARVRQWMRRCFTLDRRGLSDNEDMGCQSAWFMASALGLYPVMGQDIYWLTAPIFDEAEIQLGASGATLRIRAPGAADEHQYIARAKLDGRPLEEAWLRHEQIANGATLELELASSPTDWGKGRPPPSPLPGFSL
jgi:predicted alpha-1,2-mannosidase